MKTARVLRAPAPLLCTFPRVMSGLLYDLAILVDLSFLSGRKHAVIFVDRSGFSGRGPGGLIGLAAPKADIVSQVQEGPHRDL